MSNPALYDQLRGRLAFYQDSYWGGDHYRSPSSPTMGSAFLYRYHYDREGDTITEEMAKRFNSYLVPHPGERVTQFQTRMSLASYVNVVQPIVDAYADAVTGHVDRNLGAIEPYTKNLDGRGRNWSGHMDEVARWTAVYGMMATLIDSPNHNPAMNRLMEEQLGIAPRAILIHPTAIAWVDVDDDGTLTQFAYVDQPYVQNDVGTRRQKVRLWLFTQDHWELRTATINLTGGFLEQRDKFKEVAAWGKLNPNIVGRVPVTFSYYREVTSSKWPMGVPLIGDTCDIARQIYNDLSGAEEVHRKTTFPFLALPSKATSGELEPETRVQVGPDTALGYSSDTGAPLWVDAPVNAPTELRNHALFLFQLALRTAGLEVASDQSAQAQTGVALQIRSRDFDSRAARYGKALSGYENNTLNLIAQYMGMPPDEQRISYPDRFTLPDPSEDLARAVLLLQTLDTELGPKGKEAAARQALDSALTLSDEQLNEIVDEMRAQQAANQQQAAAIAGQPPAAGPHPLAGIGQRPPGSGAVAGVPAAKPGSAPPQFAK